MINNTNGTVFQILYLDYHAYGLFYNERFVGIYMPKFVESKKKVHPMIYFDAVNNKKLKNVVKQNITTPLNNHINEYEET